MTLAELLPFFNPALSVATLIYTWVATRDKDNTVHIKAVEEALSRKIAEHAAEQRTQGLLIESIKSEQRHAPTHRDLTELQARLAGVEARTQTTADEVKATRLTIESVRDFLLQHPIQGGTR